jgi:peptidoglycan DL-endopeptidase CwlO
VKRKLRFVLIVGLAFAINASLARATEEKEETLGDKLKHIFVRPTPTPKSHKKKKTSAASKSPTAQPSETPPGQSSPETSPSAGLTNESPASSAIPEIKPSVAPAKTPTQYFDAVRPITPHPGSRRSPTMRTFPQTQSTAFPTMTAAVEPPTEIPDERPMPSLPPITTPPPLHTPAPSLTATTTTTPTATVTATPRATTTPTPSPVARKKPTAAISTDEISDSANYSPEVRKVVDLSLELTGRNLTYKYVSADPKNGGMDSSGFIYYVLTQSGVHNVPRDAREQYIWVRKAGTFQAVLAQRDDTFELDGLKPGDLLFWASNYGISKDPDITQTMIYLGRDKSTNQRLMVGASESRSTKGQKKSGVGVFEFKVGHAAPKPNQESGPVFVGYGRIPK